MNFSNDKKLRKSESICQVNIFKFGRKTFRQNYQYTKISLLGCIQNVCESTELILENNFIIYEGSPIICDSNVIGYVTEGTLKMRFRTNNYLKVYLNKDLLNSISLKITIFWVLNRRNQN